MHDRTEPIVEGHLEGNGIERINWPVHSLDLNPTEHLSYYLGRQVAAL